MASKNYLQWLSTETPTAWWHDSADPRELAQGKVWGACGVTTNPVLASAALKSGSDFRREQLAGIDPVLSAHERAEAVMSVVVKNAAAAFKPVYRESGGQRGYVCAQVNPNLCSQEELMLAMAMRFNSWAPNISVKLPATAAEAYRRGRLRAQRAGIAPAPCFSVIMIGRIDDYLREVAADSRLTVGEDDIRQAGLAITKRSYALFRQRGYEAQLLMAALRGVHHMQGLCGGELVMSIHPVIQKLLMVPEIPRSLGIEDTVLEESLRRLRTVPEFIKAYEPDGLSEGQFIAFGLTQKTLSQFSAGG